jgi:hypothetical protein
MNIPSVPNHAALVAVLCAFCSASALPGIAAEDPAPGPASREFVLFIGLDVTFEQDGVPLRVKHVSGSQAEVVGDGVSRTISVRQVEGVRTNRETVVATTRVQLDNLKSTSGISAARDPMRAALERQAADANLASFNSDRVARAEARAANASSAATSAAAASAHLDTDQARNEARVRSEESARAADNVRDTVRDTGSEPETSDYLDHTRGQPGTRARSVDQLEITFEASSPETIKDAYAVLLTVMRLPAAPKDPVMSLAFRALPPLGPKPRRIALTHDGLPPGFAFERCEVHLYQGGRELATNFSERRIELSREEALQYLILKYTMDHAGRDLPPRPVVELLPQDFAARLPADQRTRAAEVHVRADGHVENVRLEPAGSGSADAYFEAALRDTCFYPALVKGQPVATDTTVLLTDLAP